MGEREKKINLWTHSIRNNFHSLRVFCWIIIIDYDDIRYVFALNMNTCMNMKTCNVIIIWVRMYSSTPHRTYKQDLCKSLEVAIAYNCLNNCLLQTECQNYGKSPCCIPSPTNETVMTAKWFPNFIWHALYVWLLSFACSYSISMSSDTKICLKKQSN